MGWWIALGILALLAVLPLGVSVAYDADGAVVKVILGPVKITLFPRPKKEKIPKKAKEKKAEQQTLDPKSPSDQAKAEEKTENTRKAAASSEKQAEKADKKENKPSGGPISDFFPLVRTALDMLGAFRRRLRVNVLELKVIMAADDPADLAINYGRAWAAAGNLQQKLEQFLLIKKRKIDIECDFTASQTLVIARLDLTITLGRILVTVVFYGVKALIQFLKIYKKRKGGAAK